VTQRLADEAVKAAMADLGFGAVTAISSLAGGSADSLLVTLSGGERVVLKTYHDDLGMAPAREALAANMVATAGIPATRYLAMEESRTRLPVRFAVTSYLPGQALTNFLDHPDIAGAFRQLGALLERLHRISVQGYGRFDSTSVASHEDFIRAMIAHGLENFARFGPDDGLGRRLAAFLDSHFDSVVPHSAGPVFGHDDLHPGNVLVTETPEGSLEICGIIDFGNARGADAVFDLAKCLFICTHDAPGSAAAIRAGYGPIAHRDPEAALAFYTTLQRITMWSWLRRIGVLADAETPNDIMPALRAQAKL
jgi:Ser/Thr protein kinase RdoA (MazF antagonist)